MKEHAVCLEIIYQTDRIYTIMKETKQQRSDQYKSQICNSRTDWKILEIIKSEKACRNMHGRVEKTSRGGKD